MTSEDHSQRSELPEQPESPEQPSSFTLPAPAPVSGAEVWQHVVAAPGGAGIAAGKPRRRGPLAGVAVAAVLVAAGGAYAAVSGGGNASPNEAAGGSAAASTGPAPDASGGASPSPSTVPPLAMVIPTSAGGLTLMNNSVGDRVKSELRKDNGLQAGLESALFGAYSRGDSSQYFANLTLVELSDASAHGYESLYTTFGAISALLNIDGTDGPTNPTQETPANSGGAMICGDALDGKTTLHVCTWIDATEYGLAVFSSSVSYAQADHYSLALWKASEHS